MFYVYKSKNGATYIINTKKVIESLKFYKTLNFFQKLKKQIFLIYITYISIFRENKLFTSKDIEKFLYEKYKIKLNIKDNYALLISPTNDKIIINIGSNSFKKIAFGNSLNKVKSEAEIYEFLNSYNIKTFNVSIIENIISDSKRVSFVLHNKNFIKNDADIVEALLEFFSLTSEKILLSNYLDNLIKRADILQDKTITKRLVKLKEDIGNKYIYIGMVHNDFKPWNVNIDKKFGLQIFDFEETEKKGLFLLDLINFYIDPILYKDIDVLVKYIKSLDFNKKIDRYLSKFDSNLEKKYIFYLFYIERAIFWKKNNNKNKYEKYIKLIRSCEREKNER